MKIRGHESFFIRKGWLYKGLKYVQQQNDLFTNKNIKGTDILGVGNNMVKSIRYWLKATRLTKEVKNEKHKYVQQLTDFGKLIWKYDKYMEEMGTLWLLHYQLAQNYDNATSWYYFFNEFEMIEFEKKDFISSIDKFIQMKEKKNTSLKSLGSDFDVLINTYMPRAKIHPEKMDPENNIDSVLGALNLVKIINRKEKVYAKNAPQKDTLNPLIVLAIIADSYDKNVQKMPEIKIDKILNDKGNAGKIFNLDLIQLLNILYDLQRMELLKVIRTAGLDIVRLSKNYQFSDIVEMYYKSLESTIPNYE
ncbi:MAG: DUF4007 family protein [Eubacteriaceae bacterium]|nr:DUF4007 family protein [Eubacteriaceae bacterium]